MRVVLGADAIRYPLTGIGRYALELGRALSELPLEDLRFLVGRRVVDELPVAPQPSVGARAAGQFRRFFQKSRFAADIHQFLQPISQGVALRPYCRSVYHGPNFYLPIHAGPCVTTFHDISVFTWPQCHPPERVRYMQRALPRALERADLVIADSEFGRREIAEYFSFPLDRIMTVYLAAGSEYRPCSETECAPLLSSLNLRYRGYILFVGTIEPRKNIAGLLDACERLPLATRQANPLVLAGFSGWHNADLRARFDRGVAQGWIRYLGYLSDFALPLLYAGASMLVYPSRYEGFGLPVLEAMASGTPVLCSNASSLPEVGGDAAVMVDVDDVEGFSHHIIRILEDAAWANELRTRGLDRATAFSWARVATETACVYARLT